MIDELAIERFWGKVDKRGPDECWPWLGTLSNRGYGRMMCNWRLYHVHRLSLKIAKGDGNGLFALHSCDNPKCVNPAHLRWGTHAENMADKRIRNRYRPDAYASQRRTHCARGHAFDEHNIIKRGLNVRSCRTCAVERSRAFRNGRKAAGA